MNELLQFDYNDIPENPSIVLAGRRRSGKGVLTRDLAYYYFRGQKIKTCFIFSPTCEIDTFSNNDFVPIEFRYPAIDVDVIDRIMKRQEYLIRNNPKGNHKVLILIDDIIATNDAKQARVLDRLFISARHFQISLVVCYQYIKKDFSPVQRDNVDVIFCFQQSNLDNKEALNKQYLSITEDKKEGLRLLNRYASGFQCLVILNTVNSNNYDDFCFYYTADIINKKFKLGIEYE
tara:strand:+ start:76 stop:774 length:699 start_codon:yes stop_codon:yes gene_type:complete